MLRFLARISAWALAVTIVILSLVPPGLRPETGAPHDLEHFSIFFFTGLAFGLGYHRDHGVIAVLLVAFAGAVEMAQLFVPGRHARFSDFIVDGAAMCIAVLAASLAERVRERS
jgi:VanZ family protein